MLKLSGINQFYGQSHTLWDLDIADRTGECLCLMGNGVGKTTLLNVLMGQLPVKSGQIEFDGQDISLRSSGVRKLASVTYRPAVDFPTADGRRNLRSTACASR